MKRKKKWFIERVGRIVFFDRLRDGFTNIYETKAERITDIDHAIKLYNNQINYISKGVFLRYRDIK